MEWNRTEGVREGQESPSADFVMQLYVIYGLLYFLVLVLDYFLWTSEFRLPPPRYLVERLSLRDYVTNSYKL